MIRRVVKFDTYCGRYTVSPKWELILTCGHYKYVHQRNKSEYTPPYEVDCKKCDLAKNKDKV